MNSTATATIGAENCHGQAEHTAPSTANQVVARVLELTNQERRKHGLQPLTLNSRLTAAAQAYSKEMALHDHGGHVGEDGSRVGDRVTRTGYRWSAVGENVAYGQTAPEQVMFAWMHSDGHRKNILNPKYQEIGIGYYFLSNDRGEINYHHYWTQNFATPK